MNDPVIVFDPGGGSSSSTRPPSRSFAGPTPKSSVPTPRARSLTGTRSRTSSKGLKRDVEDAFEIDGPDPDKPSSFDARISRLGENYLSRRLGLVLRDVTLQKRAAEERVRMLREQAARAEAEAANLAKDRFLATLSHELRTPADSRARHRHRHARRHQTPPTTPPTSSR